MDDKVAGHALDLAKKIQADVINIVPAPPFGEVDDGSTATSPHVPTVAHPRALSPVDQLVYFSLVKGTEDYLEAIVDQINGTYKAEWYDACAVMLRRLIEILIIEVFESKGLDSNIKYNRSGDFKRLYDLVDELGKGPWNLGKNAKDSLDNVRDIGNTAAHERRQTILLEDLDAVKQDVRNTVQELVSLSGLKKS